MIVSSQHKSVDLIVIVLLVVKKGHFILLLLLIIVQSLFCYGTCWGRLLRENLVRKIFGFELIVVVIALDGWWLARQVNVKHLIGYCYQTWCALIFCRKLLLILLL